VSLIEVRGLTKNYGTLRALNGISFSVEKGEIIGLLGPNGAGKTTTMKILTGYLQPTEGTAVVAGHDVVEAPLQVQAALGYLPENAPLYLDMAVQEYLLMMAELRGLEGARLRALLSEAVYATGLEKHLTKPIGSLSKGYRQRVGLAQAILHKPQVLILDEPTNGLDPTQILEIRGLIQRLAEDATVIVSTHILTEVEATCHRAIIIMEGEIRADSRLDELTHTSGAVVAVNRDAEVEAHLLAAPGVKSVQRDPGGDAYARYRVTGDKDLALCPLIFDVAKAQGWRLAELRPETRTLESVFRELADKKGVAA
jgi:ABC-2 type transport system ATP-binding protein